MYHFLHKYFNTFCSTCRGWFHHYIRRQQLFLMQYFPRTVTGWCIQFEIQPPELLFNHYHDWLISVPMTSTAYPDGNRLSVSGWKWDFTSHALLWFEGIWIPLHLWCISKHSQNTITQLSISHWCLLVLLKYTKNLLLNTGIISLINF